MKHILEVTLEDVNNYAILVSPLYEIDFLGGVGFSISRVTDDVYFHWIGKSNDFRALLDKYDFAPVDISKLDFPIQLFHNDKKVFANHQRTKDYLATQPEYRQKAFENVSFGW